MATKTVSDRNASLTITLHMFSQCGNKPFMTYENSVYNTYTQLMLNISNHQFHLEGKREGHLPSSVYGMCSFLNFATLCHSMGYNTSTLTSPPSWVMPPLARSYISN